MKIHTQVLGTADIAEIAIINNNLKNQKVALDFRLYALGVRAWKEKRSIINSLIKNLQNRIFSSARRLVSRTYIRLS